MWSHCANVASREIAPAAGGWRLLVSFVLQITIPADRQIETSHWSARAPLPPRPGIRIVGIFADLVFGCGGDMERGSVSVFTNIATNLVRRAEYRDGG